MSDIVLEIQSPTPLIRRSGAFYCGRLLNPFGQWREAGQAGLACVRRAAGDMLAHDVGLESGPACGGAQIGILAANRLKPRPDARSLQNLHCSLPIELFIGGQVYFAVTLSVNFLDDILGVSFGISQ